MPIVAFTGPVNAPGDSPLSAEQVWRGLVRKAEDPTGFLKGMESSRITERLPDGFVREVVHGGQTLVERITIAAPVQITFTRTGGAVGGWVSNILSESAYGLALTFVAQQPDGAGSDRAKMQAMFSEAVGTTLAEIRRLAAAGSL